MEQNNQIYDESQIQVLEGLEAVRKRPGMYIGSTSSQGLHHLVYEIVDNSIDEVLAGRCDTVDISINEDGSITVKDNGAGIPCGMHPKMKKPTLEVILTILHAGGKFGNGGYKKSGGLHGVGSSVVNALSSYMKATIHREGNIYQQEYKEGKPITEVSIIGTTDQHGTEITFYPDEKIFETIIFNYNTLANKFRETAFLNKQVTLNFEDKREGKEQINTFHYEGGLKHFVEYINNDKQILSDIIYINKTDNENNIDMEIALQYTNDYGKNIHSYVNNINTIDGGTHVNGFKAGLVKALNIVREKNNASKNEFVTSDIEEGLTSIISVRIEEPEFEGQTKTKLGTSYARASVQKSIEEYLEIFFKENTDIAMDMVNKVVSSQKFRENLKKNKELAKRKSELDSTNLKGKLAECSSKNPAECELHIVEGDSAGGSAKQSRDRRTQAILASKGKIINTEKHLIEKVLASDEIKMFVKALGTNIGDDFDITKANYHLICLMQDADSDGGHIRCLWLTFFYRHMRELIENGYVYLDVSPLYQNTIGKEVKYTFTEKEQKTFVSENKGKSIDIQRFKGLGEMNPEQLWETTMNPKTRRLYQVTLDDCVACDKMISILMGDVVEPRREFIINSL